MPLPRLRSPFARAVVPVLAGLGFFVLLGLVTYVAAVIIADNPDNAEGRLLSTTYTVGGVESVSEEIAEDGPIILPDLIETDGLRTLVLFHEGDDPQRGWRVFFGYPNDRPVDCKVDQTEGTRSFVDCEGRAIDLDDLTPAAGVRPVVEDRRRIVLDLREAVAESSTTTSVAG